MLKNTNNISLKDLNKKVVVNGWVSKKRLLGGLCFIDLRDRYGILQLVARPETKVYEIATSLKNEYCIKIEGIVIERASKNPNLKTGDIEIELTKVEILNKSINPPLIIQDKTDALEDVRLKYRYLDLRRPIQKEFILQRAKIVRSIRNTLEKLDFIDIDTPILSKSTPEGARDYVVPSRLYNGQVYALPQSPQLYKQLLMIAGFERYYQIAKCFRDEDLRADRQPEFTQIDLETSFLTVPQIQKIVEKVFIDLFKNVKNIKLKSPFKKISYKEALSKYGTDKPDLRYELYLEDFNYLKSKDNFLNRFESVRGLRFLGSDTFSRKTFEELSKLILKNGCHNAAFLKKQNGQITGSVYKELNQEQLEKLNLKENEVLVLGLDTYSKVNKGLGALRCELARKLKLIDDNKFEILWVVDFPLFELNEETGQIESTHHAFTAPKNVKNLDKDPLKCVATHYDLVLNGYELGSGSLRINQPEVQEKVFNIIGLTKEQVDEKFGFLVDAFKYGAPPHGGIGLGLDRIVMILTNTTNIKDVVAFPKTQSARDLMNQSPSQITKEQEKELGITLKVIDSE